ncbi:MAG TPA: tetratricopeptide repeat protein, partial [Terriglobales bacterium]|nr:tetratricopeptide repeat protein [Terriglobales bacterium]
LGVDLLRLQPDHAHTQISTKTFAGPRRRSVWQSRFTWAVLVLLVIAFAVGGYRSLQRFQNPRMSGKLLTVLPFESSSPNEKTNALLAGLTDTITANLSQAWGTDLQLVPAREVREQRVKTTEQAWKEFGSELVLEGSAHTVGNQIRINCSLVDPRSHRQITARTITADTNDVFGLEDQVAGEIMQLLATNVGLRSQSVPAGRSENKPEAYASYLRARGYLHEYQKAENIDLAVAELKNAVALDPRYAEAYAALGEAYLLGYQQVNRGADWVEKAQQSCRNSLVLRETAEGRICLGGVYNQTGNYGLAVPEFERAVQLDESDEDGLRGLADAYVKLGNPAAAEATYKKAAELRPNYWGVYSWLGYFYFGQARYADAAAQFKHVVTLAPNNERGYSNLGAMYSMQGKYLESLVPLKQSIEIRPSLEAFNNLGNSYFNLRRYPEAAEAFQRGLNLDDTDWLLWGNLGDSLYWSGTQRSEAKAAYEHAISRAEKRREVNPKDATVLAFLADYYAMAGNREQALKNIEQALAVAPNDSEARYRSAIVYNQLGDQERCLAALGNAIKLGYSARVIADTPDFDHLRNNAKFKKLVGLT